jgi:uncharacterized protein
MSEFAPKPEDCYELTMAILDHLRRCGCDTVICLEGVPRFSPDDNMVVCYSGEKSEKLARKSGVPLMTGGMIRGMTGVMMYAAPSFGMDVVALVEPANQSIPDPGAASEFLAPLRKMVPGMKVDSKALLEEAQQIQKRIDEQSAAPAADSVQYYGRGPFIQPRSCSLHGIGPVEVLHHQQLRRQRGLRPQRLR